MSSRRKTWSAHQPPIWEVPDDDLLSSDHIRKNIVLSMSAGDEDWTNYRRRSSGGSAVALFHQTRSRRSSRDDSSLTLVGEPTSPAAENHEERSSSSSPHPPADDMSTVCHALIESLTSQLGRVVSELSALDNLQIVEANNLSELISGHLNKDVASSSEGDQSPPYHKPEDEESVSGNGSMDADTDGEVFAQSRFDITGQTSDYRYPWVKDMSTQYDTTDYLSLSDLVTSKPTISAGAQQVSHKKTKRSQSSSTISQMPFLFPRRSESALHDGKVIVAPDVLQHSYEYFSEQSAMDHSETLDEDNNLLKYDRTRRRPCIISALDLGDSETTTPDEPPDKNSYAGDLVLHTGQALKQSSSPPNSASGIKTASHYGSDSSLIDPSHEKIRKSSKSFINKMLRPYKKSSHDLEHYLLHELKRSEFADERRLAEYKHMGWEKALTTPYTEEEKLSVSETEMSRRHAVWEIFTTECTFLIDHLMVLRHCFMVPLMKAQVDNVLMGIEPQRLFGNLDELIDLSIRFCRDFVDTLQKMTMVDFGSTDCLCSCLDKMTSYSRDGDIYHSYLLNYRSALTYLEYLRNTVEDYATYERVCEQDRRCNRLSLSALLVAPMHHWTRLPLILERVRKYTQDESEVTQLHESISKVVSSLNLVEEKMKLLKTFERVKEIAQQLVWPTVLELDPKAVIPDSLRSTLCKQPSQESLDNRMREVLNESPVILTEKDKNIDCYLFLFTDFLLITKLKNKENKKSRQRLSTADKNDVWYHVIRQPVPVSSLSVHNIKECDASAVNMKNAFVIAQKNLFQQVVAVYTIQTFTTAAKEKWLSTLRNCKERIPVVMGNGSGNSSPMLNRLFDDRPNLLKNSQVLELTSNTLPRPRSSTSPRIDLVNFTPPSRRDSVADYQKDYISINGNAHRDSITLSRTSRPISTGYSQAS